MNKSIIKEWCDLHFGMFIHFGLYSLLGGVWRSKHVTEGYSEQIMKHGQIPLNEYKSLAGEFNPIAFNPDRIVSLAMEAGMKYIVITAKHHDGFCLFHSKYTDYNVVDASPYGEDIVLKLANACEKVGLKFGIYFSWIDWHYPYANPMSDHNSDFITKKHMTYNLLQIEELLSNYGNIAELWFDMGAPTLEQSREMIDTVHSLQPCTMVNGRVWHGLGDFTVLGDNDIPNINIEGPWETPASIYHSTWGYRSWQERSNLNVKVEEQLSNLQKVWRAGGNYLLNIGLKGDGSIVPFEAGILCKIGTRIKELDSLRCDIINIQEEESTILLREKDAEVSYRFIGADYYSNTPVLAKKKWKVSIPDSAKYTVLLYICEE